MTSGSADRMAERLFEEHEKLIRFMPLRDGDAPLSLDLAYEVQDGYIARLRARMSVGATAGYKVGLTNKAMQEFCGVDQPVTGHIFTTRLHETGARLACADFVRLGIESEMAIVFARPVPKDADAAALRASIASVHAAFEVIEDRAADYSTLDAASIVADNGWNAGIVLGEGRPVSEIADFAAIPGILSIDGTPRFEGSSGDVLGSPLNVVAWLAERLDRRGESLEAGQIVMTGAIVPTKFPRPGEVFRFELGALPPVEVHMV